MKVLDLKCGFEHSFEGWFASEDDYASQCQRGLVQCPVCGDQHITKKLSAPRLSLSGHRREVPSGSGDTTQPGTLVQDVFQNQDWFAMARAVLANTTDVGERFAEEARKIYYGESPIRGIRGQASLEETHSLVEEGIEVMAFHLPPALKEPLQ